MSLKAPARPVERLSTVVDASAGLGDRSRQGISETCTRVLAHPLVVSVVNLSASLAIVWWVANQLGILALHHNVELIP